MTAIPPADFSLPATSGQTVSLSALRGKKVVLYFYPKDNTPGCTNETRDFGTLHAAFSAAGCEVFGISRDSLKSHENFKAKLELPFELISDTDETACTIFDVIKMKNMYGKQVRGIQRSTFVLATDGSVAREWRGVKVPGHAEEVLAFVQSL
ncbi:MAG: peroxiredoxin [Azoarcus sp.]|jgi:peroxiredoxin Q/BCP|nr:peroxiredoxin [Azoarcus sp.]MDD2874712.1 peroxiredoxin [Azoarcus sp.]MDX9837054.1 peroxiredoxin [Azoarcus sp.]